MNGPGLLLAFPNIPEPKPRDAVVVSTKSPKFANNLAENIAKAVYRGVECSPPYEFYDRETGVRISDLKIILDGFVSSVVIACNGDDLRVVYPEEPPVGGGGYGVRDIEAAKRYRPSDVVRFADDEYHKVIPSLGHAINDYTKHTVSLSRDMKAIVVIANESHIVITASEPFFVMTTILKFRDGSTNEQRENLRRAISTRSKMSIGTVIPDDKNLLILDTAIVAGGVLLVETFVSTFVVFEKFICVLKKEFDDEDIILPKVLE